MSAGYDWPSNSRNPLAEVSVEIGPNQIGMGHHPWEQEECRGVFEGLPRGFRTSCGRIGAYELLLQGRPSHAARSLEWADSHVARGDALLQRQTRTSDRRDVPVMPDFRKAIDADGARGDHLHVLGDSTGRAV